jgi:hypothetical protein
VAILDGPQTGDSRGNRGAIAGRRSICAAVNRSHILTQLERRSQYATGEGQKFDSDKLRYELLPPELLEEVARVLTFGAHKYSARNWELGMAWSRPFGALMRHMWAWWRGEEKDPETGYSHLAHAACCIAFLVSYEARNTGTDDRPKGEKQ